MRVLLVSQMYPGPRDPDLGVFVKQVADELEAAGYRRGNVTNATGQQAESVVLYARTARREAQAVARELDISQTEPVDARSRTLAGDATVVIVVGADQTR